MLFGCEVTSVDTSTTVYYAFCKISHIIGIPETGKSTLAIMKYHNSVTPGGVYVRV